MSEQTVGGDVEGQARAWKSVFDLCVELGMDDINGLSGRELVFNFIRRGHKLRQAYALLRDMFVAPILGDPMKESAKFREWEALDKEVGGDAKEE